MSGDDTHPAGLLTDEETELFGDPETDLDDHPEVRDSVKHRLTETLHDFTVLYPTLPAADLEAVFTAADDETLAPIRAGTQDGLALLILGMLLGDDLIDTRLRDAIQNAGLSYGEEIDVTLELRRGPLPTLEQFAAKLDDDGFTEQAFPLFEHFLNQPGTDPDVLEEIASKLNVGVTPEEKAELDTAMSPFARAPQTVITGVSVSEEPFDHEQEDA